MPGWRRSHSPCYSVCSTWSTSATRDWGQPSNRYLTATILGLVFGVLYDRTHNLIGASLAHSIADFSGTVIPLLAWLLASR